MDNGARARCTSDGGCSAFEMDTSDVCGMSEDGACATFRDNAEFLGVTRREEAGLIVGESNDSRLIAVLVSLYGGGASMAGSSWIALDFDFTILRDVSCWVRPIRYKLKKGGKWAQPSLVV